MLNLIKMSIVPTHPTDLWGFAPIRNKWARKSQWMLLLVPLHYVLSWYYCYLLWSLLITHNYSHHYFAIHYHFNTTGWRRSKWEWVRKNIVASTFVLVMFTILIVPFLDLLPVQNYSHHYFILPFHCGKYFYLVLIFSSLQWNSHLLILPKEWYHRNNWNRTQQSYQSTRC